MYLLSPIHLRFVLRQVSRSNITGASAKHIMRRLFLTLWWEYRSPSPRSGHLLVGYDIVLLSYQGLAPVLSFQVPYSLQAPSQAPADLGNEMAGIQNTDQTDLAINTSSRAETRSRSNSTETLPTGNPPIDKTIQSVSDEIATHDFYFIPIPMYLRYDPNAPPHFSLLLNIVFGLASTFGELVTSHFLVHH